MRVNGIRTFYLIHTPEGALGAWVDEYNRIVQVPRQWHDLMRCPLSELMQRIREHGYTIEETGRKM